MSLSTWQAVENPVQSRQDCLGGRGIGSLSPPLTTAGGRTRQQFGLRFAWTENHESFRTGPGCHPARANLLGRTSASTPHPSGRMAKTAWISPPSDLAQGMTDMHSSGAAGAKSGFPAGTQSRLHVIK